MWEVSNKTSLINLFSVGMCDVHGLHLQPIHVATVCAHPSTRRLTVSLRENERSESEPGFAAFFLLLVFSLNRSGCVHGQVKDRVKGGYLLLHEADPYYLSTT